MHAHTILLIEDDPAVAHGLRDGLAQHGFRVTWHAGGAAGLAAAAADPPDLFILDVRLPDSSGFDLCRALRRDGYKQPIVMLTVQRDEIDKVLGLEMGADDYITKPFGLRELVARLRALLRRAYGELADAGDSAESPHRLHVADLTIDLARSAVLRDGAPLNLTPTEYRLFVYLAQHAGQALSRAQLLDGVWGYAADVDSERTVNVHIRRLREKVERDPGRPRLILTVPGVGYRLVADADRL